MIKHLIHRPISVFMAFTALFILGIITYMNIPVSLLPDIAIPEITVQISGKNTSARELENTVVTPVRQQLLQVSKLQDIRSETRDGNAIIHLSFEYGANTDLSFIEVNEKIDAAMSYLPKEIDRPRVIKASATDIPVFSLDLTLKSDSVFQETDIGKFIELSDFAETVIKRRFEQLNEVAIVDISGLTKKQVSITPNQQMLDVSGINTGDIEHALNSNNIDPGSMVVKDGYFEYVIRFTSILRTIQDIENIYVRKHDRIYQLKDIAKVELTTEKEKGLCLYNGKRAIVLSVVKQSEENMSDMQDILSKIIDQFKKDYPEIEFNITQNQTELLDYTISNLQENLILAFLFVLLVSIFFLKDGRASIIIGMGLFVSLVISLMFFYFFKISLNVVSLTGLILATGMMIDNSIIVTDNISQYRKAGLSLADACVLGTNEVSGPMLSSVMTTISVFLPLIFLSGIAGALFFDQAFSVTVGLLVSYITGITFIPVLYKIVYTAKIPFFARFKQKEKSNTTNDAKLSLADKVYDAGIHWIFSHKILTCVVMLAVFPICFWLFMIIPKEKMPDINQNELMVFIEWNENIHIDENYARCLQVMQSIEGQCEEYSSLVGQQQFLLNRDKEQSSSESQLYLKTRKASEIGILQDSLSSYFSNTFPRSIVSFAPAGTIFEKIFMTGEADLVVEYYLLDRTKAIDANTIRTIEDDLSEITGERPEGVSFQHQLNLHINREILLLYDVSYDQIHKALRTAFKENQFATLRSQQEYLPIILGDEDRTVDEVLSNTLIDLPSYEGKINSVALSTFVSTSDAEDLKTIVAGKAGEYIPFHYYKTDKVEEMVTAIKAHVGGIMDWDVDFSGGFFANKKMIAEMILILLISIMLMYFILAAQFEDFKQPFIVLLEIPIDIAAALALLFVLGHSLNLMSAIGIVVTCGIIINDSILKVDIMNQLKKEGMPLMEAIHEAGRRRLKAILMTSLTSIVCMAPLLLSNDLGSELEKPLAIATIGGMIIGTPISLFVVPLMYWWIYRKEENKDKTENTSNKTNL